MSSSDIRRFFQTKKSDREPLYELQPDTGTKEILPEKQKKPGKIMNKPGPKRKKKSLSRENTPCPKSWGHVHTNVGEGKYHVQKLGVMYKRDS